MTAKDVAANDLSDTLAKAAVEAHRVDKAVVTLWKSQIVVAEARAKWIGVATHESKPTLSSPTATLKQQGGKPMLPRELVRMPRMESMDDVAKSNQRPKLLRTKVGML